MSDRIATGHGGASVMHHGLEVVGFGAAAALATLGGSV